MLQIIPPSPHDEYYESHHKNLLPEEIVVIAATTHHLFCLSSVFVDQTNDSTLGHGKLLVLHEIDHATNSQSARGSPPWRGAAPARRSAQTVPPSFCGRGSRLP